MWFRDICVCLCILFTCITDSLFCSTGARLPGLKSQFAADSFSDLGTLFNLFLPKFLHLLSEAVPGTF